MEIPQENVVVDADQERQEELSAIQKRGVVMNVLFCVACAVLAVSYAWRTLSKHYK